MIHGFCVYKNVFRKIEKYNLASHFHMALDEKETFNPRNRLDVEMPSTRVNNRIIQLTSKRRNMQHKAVFASGKALGAGEE